MASRSGNQWKENALVFNFPTKGCSTLRENIPDFFRVVILAGNHTYSKAGTCLIPRGRYLFDDDPVNLIFPNFPILPYGHYRFTLVGGIAGSTVSKFCMGVEGGILPKVVE